LDRDYTDKAVKAVFLHRQTPIDELPIQFDDGSMKHFKQHGKNTMKRLFFFNLRRTFQKQSKKL